MSHSYNLGMRKLGHPQKRDYRVNDTGNAETWNKMLKHHKISWQADLWKVSHWKAWTNKTSYCSGHTVQPQCDNYDFSADTKIWNIHVRRIKSLINIILQWPFLGARQYYNVMIIRVSRDNWHQYGTPWHRTPTLYCETLSTPGKWTDFPTSLSKTMTQLWPVTQSLTCVTLCYAHT